MVTNGGVSGLKFFKIILWPPSVEDATLYFCLVVSFFFLVFYSSPNLSGPRLDVYHTSTHGDVALGLI